MSNTKDMERTTFLKNYRLRLKSNGAPYEPDRNGPAISHQAVDERTGEPVFVTLIPVESIDPSARQKFEEQASAMQKLRHVNIAKVLDFGREGDDYIYVSEHLPGESLATWIQSHGPMAADAALRVTEQIVSVLSSASFHKLPYPSVQPSDIIIVPGQTPEGTWPPVKLTNVGLPALRAEGEAVRVEAPALPAEQTGAPPEPARASNDIRAEIYSVGATLYFLLTGVALSGPALPTSPKLSKFPKPLRNLLRRMLHRDPGQRPKDLLVLTEMIRHCLLKIERRRELADRYGLPLRTTVRRPAVAVGRSRFFRRAVPIAAVLLLGGVIAAVLLAEPIRRLVIWTGPPKPIGVVVGVPESSSRPGISNTSPTKADASVSQPANGGVPVANEPAANAAVASNSPQAETHGIQQAQTENIQPGAAVPAASAASSPSIVAEASPPPSPQMASSKPDVADQSATSNQSSSQSKKKSVASTSRRGRSGQNSMQDSPSRGVHSVRARVVGITSDGRLILRLPSGRTAFVAPDGGQGEFAPRRHRRPMINRDQMYGPPEEVEPDVFPED